MYFQDPILKDRRVFFNIYLDVIMIVTVSFVRFFGVMVFYGKNTQNGVNRKCNRQVDRFYCCFHKPLLELAQYILLKTALM